MRGTGSINTPSYSPMLYGVGARGASLLAALHDNNKSASPPANPLAALDKARGEEAARIALTGQRPDVRRDLTRYEQALARARTPSELLGNPTALKVLLTSHGLGDQTGNRGLAVKALLSDPSAAGALVTRLVDTRWRTAARRCAFAAHGLGALREPELNAEITRAYAEQVWWRLLGQDVPGFAHAMDFLKRAGTIEETEQVMGDPTFRAVVLATLDPHRDVAFRGLAAQRAMLANRIDIMALRDPATAYQFARRYLLAETAEAGVEAADDGREHAVSGQSPDNPPPP